MLKRNFVVILMLSLALLTGCTTSHSHKNKDQSTQPINPSEITFKKNKEFAFLTGMTSIKTPPLVNHYDTIVVDATKLNKNQIATLHLYATHVYGYLDVGHVKAKSKAYKANKSSTRGYVDNSKTYYKMAITKSWRQYLYKKARKQIKRGIDGIVLDHYDIFNGKPKTYKKLFKVVKYMHKKNMPVYLMNDKMFITEYINNGDQVIETKNKDKKDDDKEKEENEPLPYISGIIQENVFTTIDPSTFKTKKQSSSVSSHYKKYLEFCQAHDIKPYIIEYTKNSDWKAVIKAYCKSHDITYYISTSLTHNEE
ncbi:MAG: endo alpha-1,4 polygalactosaminidase [Erysipelotrichaceae bacterium]|nr:endo alpha-1,4 polygalactosaminidase [Erysipelotrichaceae bacterium]